MPETIRAREKRIADDSFCSAGPYEGIATILGFPESVKGLKMVDIGSGASSAVLELRKRGAQAYGVDAGYRDLAKMVRSAERYLRLLRERGNIAAYKERATTLAAFKADYQHNRTRYKPELAGELSFLPNSVDLVFSELCLSYFLIEDSDVFMQAADKALSILKPLGDHPKEKRSLVLHPWVGEVDPFNIWNETKRANARAFTESLADRGFQYFIEQPRVITSPRLRVVKI